MERPAYEATKKTKGHHLAKGKNRGDDRMLRAATSAAPTTVHADPFWGAEKEKRAGRKEGAEVK